MGLGFGGITLLQRQEKHSEEPGQEEKARNVLLCRTVTLRGKEAGWCLQASIPYCLRAPSDIVTQSLQVRTQEAQWEDSLYRFSEC